MQKCCLSRDDARNWCHSFLESAPVVAVSSRTGAGLADLKEKPKEVAQRVPARSTELVTRLPIDRAFSMKGFGPVVTGTLISGEISEGAELELLPKKLTVRVRGTQVHGKAVARAVAGQRTAVNLAGVDVAQLERGMVLAQPRALRTTQIMDARIDVLPNAPRACDRVRVCVCTERRRGSGPSEFSTTFEIASGKSGLAQLRVESPISTVHGDRFILRSYSPARRSPAESCSIPCGQTPWQRNGQARARINRLRMRIASTSLPRLLR